MADYGNHTEPQSIGPRVPPRWLPDPLQAPGDIEYAAASRRRTIRVVGAALVALSVGLLITAIIGRDRIMAIWPSTAGVYQALNLLATPSAGLKISLTVTRNGGGFSVIVPAHSSRTFRAPAKVGDYRFHCMFHSSMHGTLKVR